MKRKGQAAMEFLMTYGWAILAAIIVIAVLAIYFRPGNVLGTNAFMSAPFSQVSSIIDDANGVDIEFRNAGAEPLNTISFTFDITSDSALTCTPALTDALGGGNNITSLNAGEKAFVRCDPGAMTVGDTFTADFTVSYLRPGATIASQSSGSISGKVQ